MNVVSKKNRDIAMRAICEFFEEGETNRYISAKYLYKNGLSENVDAFHVMSVLESMGYIKLVPFPDNTGKYIELTNEGRHYFETQKDSKVERIKRGAWDIALLLIGFFLGLLSAYFAG